MPATARKAAAFTLVNPRLSVHRWLILSALLKNKEPGFPGSENTSRCRRPNPQSGLLPPKQVHPSPLQQKPDFSPLYCYRLLWREWNYSDKIGLAFRCTSDTQGQLETCTSIANYFCGSFLCPHLPTLCSSLPAESLILRWSRC